VAKTRKWVVKASKRIRIRRRRRRRRRERRRRRRKNIRSGDNFLC
jgi:hypothetical protein